MMSAGENTALAKSLVLPAQNEKPVSVYSMKVPLAVSPLRRHDTVVLAVRVAGATQQPGSSRSLKEQGRDFSFASPLRSRLQMSATTNR